MSQWDHGWTPARTLYESDHETEMVRLSQAGYRIRFTGPVTAAVTTPRGAIYTVDDGACSCPAGIMRRPCKHARIVSAAIPCRMVPGQRTACDGILLAHSWTAPGGEPRQVYQCQSCRRLVTTEVVSQARKDALL